MARVLVNPGAQLALSSIRQPNVAARGTQNRSLCGLGVVRSEPGSVCGEGD
jgi:hypothetical protein